MSKTKTARDLMITPVVTVSPESPLRDAWQTLFDNRISGAPVINAHGNIVGVISQSDLARRAFRNSFDPNHAASFYQSLPWSEEGGATLEDSLAQLGHAKVEEVMNPYVIMVDVSATVAEIASAMRSHRIHRVMVAEGKQLRGIITAFDMIQLLETV